MAVETLQLVSASQINTYRECQRKFGWSYLAKIKEPGSDATSLGTEVENTQLQPYLAEARPFDLERWSGKIAEAGLEYLPAPQTPGLRLQKHFVMPSASSEEFAYQGFLDFFLPDSKDMPLCDGGRPLVGDFKTTKDFVYAKSKSKLAKDVQAQLYAMAMMVETGARELDLVWLYLHTVKPKPKRVHLKVLADDVAEQFSKIEESALEMAAVRKEFASSGLDAATFIKTRLPVPSSPAVCHKYGKDCFYQGMCNPSPEDFTKRQLARHKQNLTDPMKAETMDLLANLRKTKPVEAEETKQPVSIGINPPEKDLPLPESVSTIGAEEIKPLVSIQESAKKAGRPKKVKELDTPTPEVVTVSADLSDAAEFRNQAFVELTKTLGDAFLKFSQQLQVSK